MRNTRRLSQDETDVVEAVSQMCSLIQSRQGFEWYGLVDTVFDYPDGKFFNECADVINCYVGHPQLEALASAAPCLVSLQDNDALAHRLTSLFRHCSARPMLSFFASEVSGARMLEHWRAFYMARLDEGQEMLLRFADTRVLPNLQHVLALDQWAAFCGAVRYWYYVDRTGKIAECAVSNIADYRHDQLQLSNHQVDRLIKLSYPDILMQRIIESLPDAIPPLICPSSLYELISASYRLAQRYSIENEADVFSLAVAACLTEGKSNKNAGLYRLLESGSWSAGNLGDEMFEANIV
ncbi:DUF4123 domain-containing protein [Massilia sp. CT11-137]|uniref:DUF4123 domain-containing protein n=1 Tax=Massilia sp. CT11-137 TaxID=3393901 RepID=UPI0039AF5464